MTLASSLLGQEQMCQMAGEDTGLLCQIKHLHVAITCQASMVNQSAATFQPGLS